VILTFVLVLAAVVGGWVLYLNSQLSGVPRFNIDLERPGRPAAVAAAGDSKDILLVGVDDGLGTDLRDALAAEDWPKGVFRSDTIMVLHLADGPVEAQLISIPRDSYVPVRGYGRTKINAAFSYGGPSLLARTVEDLTALRIDHVAVVDLDGFREISEALGGVTVQVPGTGPATLAGAAALKYVRERESLPNGDFDRIQRQQNFLRAMLTKTVSGGALKNPVAITRLLGLVTSHLAVDAGFTNGAIRSLALESRGLRTRDIRFVTVPVLGTATIDGASVVRLDEVADRQMFAAVARGQFGSWYANNPVEELPSAADVN
jgi:LCP family protein required for cell wall assembly